MEVSKGVQMIPAYGSKCPTCTQVVRKKYASERKRRLAESRRRNERFKADPEKERAYRERQRAYALKWYRNMRKDPARYAAWLADRRSEKRALYHQRKD